MPDVTPAELKSQIALLKEEIKTVNEIGRLLRATLQTRQMIRHVASYLKQTFPIALCGIFLAEPRKLFLTRFAPISQVDMTNISRQILRTASEKTQKHFDEDSVAVMTEDDFGTTGSGPIGSIRSHLSFPMTIGGTTGGILSIFSAQQNIFNEQDIHAIQTVVDQLQAALRNALLVERLQEADRSKNELLSIISHELRIPLTVIREGVSLLSEGALGPVNAEQTEFLGTVSQNVDRLHHLLDKVLLATQVITGKLAFSFETVDIDQLLSETEIAQRPAADGKGVRLEKGQIPHGLTWKADKRHLQQGLVYLIENAVQATDSGGKVSISAAADDNELEIRITDTGKGIPHEALPSLFDSFRSIGGIHERKTGGLGLGLFITKALVEGHGGTIAVQSEAGNGTSFKIRLPQNPGPQKPSGSPRR
ncbi:MAG: GAF domain-containing sensor histidine kinase [Candidatus Omnitrophica bacterium]|nr:GAF domain-containing sensor histidine kinase [Candidatus Omnitrophota bacterium]